MTSISAGRVSQLRCQAEIAVGETFIPASAPPLQPHRHPSAQLHLVTQGRYTESSRGATYELGPGSALFRPAGELHGNRFFGSDVRGLLVDIEPALTSRFLPGLDLSKPCYFPPGTFDDLRSTLAYEARQNASERHTVLYALAFMMA